jgi:phosphatidylinositol glycan class S
VEPTKLSSPNGTIFTLSPKSLGHFINSAEWNLASVVNPMPPLNFLLYVPSLQQSPLHIIQPNGSLLNTNAFLIPRWGGVVISNPIQEFGEVFGVDEFVFEEKFLKKYMEIFLGQLRGLIGVDEIWKRGLGVHLV